MTVLLGTLVLNEMEWLAKSYEQHKDWPGLTKWVFVEAADRAYANGSPDMVSEHGLSVDGTTEWLEELASRDGRVVHVKHGFFGDGGSMGKVEARDRYLKVANEVEPTIVITLDADEFYTHEHQRILEPKVMDQGGLGVIFHRREIWRPPSIADAPIMGLEVIGGFWAIPCCHWWKFQRGMEYKSNHNSPEVRGRPLGPPFSRCDRHADAPQMIHLGFASGTRTRRAKHEYYRERGEETDGRRHWYVASRGAWFDWTPDGERELPGGAKVIPYEGPVPECFQYKIGVFDG